MKQPNLPTEYLMPTPLQRLPDEPSAAHRALVDYAKLGEARSLDALVAQYRSDPTSSPPTRRRNTLATWSVRFLWAERVATYDEDLRAAELAQHEAIWTARREQVREEAWALAQRLRERAIEMLDQCINQARWNPVEFAKAYDAIARLAAGMDTDQQRVIVEGLDASDLETLTDEELARLWAKMSKKR